MFLKPPEKSLNLNFKLLEESFFVFSFDEIF
jgi:hypothetical protein